MMTFDELRYERVFWICPTSIECYLTKPEALYMIEENGIKLERLM